MIRRRRQRYTQQSRVFKPRTNNQIRVPRVQVIDQHGRQLGPMDTAQALTLATEAGLDLVEIAATNNPPVVKITDYGKYMYEKERKERQSKKSSRASSSEIKTVRITFRAGEHDLGVRAKQADAFFSKGHRVRVELKLRGRERAMYETAKTKIDSFLNMLQTPHTVEGGIKKSPAGMVLLLLSK